MLTTEKLEAVSTRFSEIETQMAQNPDPQTYIALSRDYAELVPLVEKIRSLKKAEDALEAVREVLHDSESEPELLELAQSEEASLKEHCAALTRAIELALLPKDAADARSAILELRAGTGGDEAALFAGDLFRMYEAYAARHRWKIEILSISPGEVGGFKEIIAAIAGNNVFARLKFESGVHRVQRVPDTESGGRIHTSAATVAVLPEAEEVDVTLEEKDLRIDVFRASGAGGQHVNTTDSAVRITHLPTGIVVSVQDERSQHKNKAKALKLLRARIFEVERNRAMEERAESRRIQVGSGDRSERIRTYNFPQGRVTDHRIGLTLYKLESILAGEALEEVIDALIVENEAAILASHL